MFTKVFLIILFSIPPINKKNIIVGAERLNDYLDIICNKSVGLLVNHTSKIKNSHLVDTLVNRNIKIKKIFSPEHGFSGNIERGKEFESNIYKVQNNSIPVISMYGKNRVPKDEDLSELDIIIFDIQDVGARFYTYISAMHDMMEKCAELGIDFIVLDRPNPNGDYIDGPVLDTLYKSYIGMHPIPIVHGCTVGEIARMIKGEGWIKNHEKLNLNIITIHNWTHNDEYILPVRPSPNLPNQKSVRLYPSLCLFEQTIVSVGRGTPYPFQVLGHPNYNNGSFSFTPVGVSEESKPKLENEKCYGIDLRNTKVEKKLSLKYLIIFYNFLKNKNNVFFNNYFYRIAGNKILENQIKEGMSEKEIRLSWKADIDNYKRIRKKYLLYKDFE